MQFLRSKNKVEQSREFIFSQKFQSNNLSSNSQSKKNVFGPSYQEQKTREFKENSILKQK